MPKNTEGPTGPSSLAFERAVLDQVYGDDPYIKKLRKIDGDQGAAVARKLDPKRTVTVAEGQDGSDTTSVRSWGWWQPPQDSQVFEYLQNSSMHGLKYVAQPRRHLSERIFWAIAFLLAAGAAGYFIRNIWNRYSDNPVVYSFRPIDTPIHSIPFPAVTICNIDRVSIDVINQLKVRASKPPDDPFAITAKEELYYANLICNYVKSFAKLHGFAANRGELKLNRGGNFTTDRHLRGGVGLTWFLYFRPNPCDEMIIRCVWGTKRRNCEDLFKPTVTGLGRCCTFNNLPGTLLSSEAVRQSFRQQPRYNGTTRTYRPIWTESETKKWEKWDYTKGIILDDHAKRPLRQRRPGSDYGLSILLNAQSSHYFCPSSDAEGFRALVHSQLESAPVEKFGSMIGQGNEIFMEVEPVVTMADPNIRRVGYHKRGCVFPDEITLLFFRPYSPNNCVQECLSMAIYGECSCVPFTLPRLLNMTVCASEEDSEEYQCAVRVERAFSEDLRNHCDHCEPLCSSVTYKTKITRANLQNASKLWMDVGDRRPPDWATDNVTVLHVYYSRLSYVSRERRELYGLTDLISNTANLLTLCLGFSILSGVELVYFLTVRVFINRIWRYRSKKDTLRQAMDTRIVRKRGDKRNTQQIHAPEPRFIHVRGPARSQQHDTKIQQHEPKKNFPLYKSNNKGSCMFFISSSDDGSPQYSPTDHNTQRHRTDATVRRHRQ